MSTSCGSGYRLLYLLQRFHSLLYWRSFLRPPRTNLPETNPVEPDLLRTSKPSTHFSRKIPFIFLHHMPLYQAVNCPIFTCTEPSVFGFCSPSFCDEASARSGCSAAKSHRESARSVRKSDCKLGPKNLETFTPNPNHLDRPASTSNLGHRILRTEDQPCHTLGAGDSPGVGTSTDAVVLVDGFSTLCRTAVPPPPLPSYVPFRREGRCGFGSKRCFGAIGCPDGKAHVANASKGRDSVLSCTSAGLACAFTWAKLC